MTAPDRIDQLLANALEDLAAPQSPDYFDDALERAMRAAQRPAWTFPGRWIPMDTVTRRSVLVPTLPWRPIMLLLALVALLATALIITVGTQPDLEPAPPFGPAANGLITYSIDGDIYTRDLETGVEQLLIGGSDVDVLPGFSRDGTLLMFGRVSADSDELATVMVAKADGSGARALSGPAIISDAVLSPDGSQLAVIADSPRVPSLSVVSVNGGLRRDIELPVTPLEGLAWRPPDGRELIFRGMDGLRRAIYGVRPEGTGFRQISAKTKDDDLWPHYALSSDGKMLAYTQALQPVFNIRTLDLDTGVDQPWGAALPEPAIGTGPYHWGSPVLSPDGTKFAFERYWDEHGGTLYSQVWVATVASDGADAVAVGTLHRSESAHDPFGYAFAPDGSAILIQHNDVDETWLANPAGGDPERIAFLGDIAWGDIVDPPDWQRLAP